MGASLIERFTPGTVLLAAGQRLARHLVQRYARECRAAGMEVWETPVILTWGAWLKRLWLEGIERGADDRLLLSPAQELALWEWVIAESEASAQLLSPPVATAGLARSAWTLMQAWAIPPGELAAGGDDVQVFAAWQDRFDQLSRQQRLLDGARLAGALAELIEQRRVPVPARVLLAGFDELTPQQERLFEALRRAGCAVSGFAAETPPREPAIVRLACASTEDELRAAAQWARRRLQANPQLRLGILAPDLAAQNRNIRRIFDEVLLPQTSLPGHEELARPYNVSLGEPLAQQALVGAALSILELAQGHLPFDHLSALLRSPYLAGAEVEATRRALLDAELRDRGDVRVGIGALTRALDRAQGGAADCALLRERVQRFRRACPASGESWSPSRWLIVVAQLLAALGWPGDRARSSVEHQTIEAWRALLSEFGALDAVLPRMRFGALLARLRRLARETLFQRETPETPVQILGVLEASGLEFDALWVLGLHDEVWPAAPRPNPFLPLALQRARRLPHASAERELEFCTQLTQRLLRSAPEAVLSYPAREEDRDLRPSPLLREIVPVEAAALIGEPDARYRDRIHGAARLEAIVDWQLPALAVGTYVEGGTFLFRSQSACAFRGAAEFRLGACEFPEPEPGLSAADRGTLVHRLLARLWSELGSHAGLMSMTTAALTQRVAALAQHEIEQLRLRRPETVTERIAALEVERLVALIDEWLTLERSRAAFTVRREEVRTQLAVGGIETQARMDRVDELADGALVVIDYKTGEARPNGWHGERPAEPQLPLYALYGVARERLAGVFFGRLSRGESRFAGLARADGIVPGVGAYPSSRDAAQYGTWDKLLTDWARSLESLGQEFRAGHAQVSPREPQACDLCHLHGFCRIRERRARLVDVGEGSDE